MLIDPCETEFLDGERIPGVGEFGYSAIEVVGEGERFPEIGLNEEYIDTVPFETSYFFAGMPPCQCPAGEVHDPKTCPAAQFLLFRDGEYFRSPITGEFLEPPHGHEGAQIRRNISLWRKDVTGERASEMLQRGMGEVMSADGQVRIVPNPGVLVKMLFEGPSPKVPPKRRRIYRFKKPTEEGVMPAIMAPVDMPGTEVGVMDQGEWRLSKMDDPSFEIVPEGCLIPTFDFVPSTGDWVRHWTIEEVNMKAYKPMWYENGALNFSDGTMLKLPDFVHVGLELEWHDAPAPADGVWPTPNDGYTLDFEHNGQKYGVWISFNAAQIACADVAVQEAHLRQLKRMARDSIWHLQVKQRNLSQAAVDDDTDHDAYAQEAPWSLPASDTDPFAAGEPVRLKSGGPLMTVEAIEDDGRIRCRWTKPSGLVEHGDFAEAELERAIES